VFSNNNKKGTEGGGKKAPGETITEN